MTTKQIKIQKPVNSKELYYNLLHKHKLPDVFRVIPEISYSQKYSILFNLLQKYSSLCVEHALCEYEIHYIQTNKINLEILYSTLKGICERLKHNKY